MAENCNLLVARYDSLEVKGCVVTRKRLHKMWSCYGPGDAVAWDWLAPKQYLKNPFQIVTLVNFLYKFVMIAYAGILNHTHRNLHGMHL